MNIKPNLFVIGEPKTGTTALYKYFKNHPQIFIPKTKEPNRFCKDLGRTISKKKYAKLYDELSDEKYAVDMSVRYAYSDEAPKEIHKYNPKAKIIYGIREPISFLKSFHRKKVKNLSEDKTDFFKALKLEEQRKKGRYQPKHMKFNRELFYRDRIKYANNLKKYLNTFSKNNIYIFIRRFQKK